MNSQKDREQGERSRPNETLAGVALEANTMTNHPRFHATNEGGGGAGESKGRQAERRHPSDDVHDPFFKDPALTVGEDVAKSLGAVPHESGEREVIRDAFTNEVPNESEPATYDGSGYGAQMSQILSDKQRESDSRPKGISARDIQEIYGKQWRSDDTLTIHEGLPKKSFSIWNIPGLRLLVKLAIFGAILLALVAIRLPIVDEDGVDTTSSLPVWLYQQATMGSDQQMMQKLDPLERQFAITRTRIRRVGIAATKYELSFGAPPPSVLNLVDENLIQPNRASDGWGNLFRIETQGELIVVRSAGKDHAFNTDDDITVVGDSGINFSIRHYSREVDGVDGPY